MFNLSEKSLKIGSKIGFAVTILALSACAHSVNKPPAPVDENEIVATPEPLEAAPDVPQQLPTKSAKATHKKHGKHIAANKRHKGKKKSGLVAARGSLKNKSNKPKSDIPSSTPTATAPATTQELAINSNPSPPPPPNFVPATSTIGTEDASSGFWDNVKIAFGILILIGGVAGLFYVSPKARSALKLKNNKRRLVINS